tara:strand:+ start:269 stop:538 length:270 start_codon:yes stop_codon:yes gene_type:complete
MEDIKMNKGIHLIKYTGDGATSRIIWNANPVERLIKSLDDIKGKLTDTEMVLMQTLDIIEFACKKYKIDWKKTYLEIYKDDGYVEGESE